MNNIDFKLLIKSYLKYIIIVIVIIIIIIGFLVYYFINNNNSSQEILTEREPVLKENKPSTQEEKKIVVDVKGAVNKPGVYELPSGSRVSDAIEKSGGLASNADTSVINLSKMLSDEMVIIVYTKEEVKNLNKNNDIKLVEKECVCPKITNNACISDSSNNNSNKQKISLNTATLEELQTLSGIGKSKALEIIKYRETNGGFKNIEELMNISGIGQSTFEKIKDFITI